MAAALEDIRIVEGCPVLRFSFSGVTGDTGALVVGLYGHVNKLVAWTDKALGTQDVYLYTDDGADILCGRGENLAGLGAINHRQIGLGAQETQPRIVHTATVRFYMVQGVGAGECWVYFDEATVIDRR